MLFLLTVPTVEKPRVTHLIVEAVEGCDGCPKCILAARKANPSERNYLNGGVYETRLQERAAVHKWGEGKGVRVSFCARGNLSSHQEARSLLCTTKRLLPLSYVSFVNGLTDLHSLHDLLALVSPGSVRNFSRSRVVDGITLSVDRPHLDNLLEQLKEERRLNNFPGVTDEEKTRNAAKTVIQWFIIASGKYRIPLSFKITCDFVPKNGSQKEELGPGEEYDEMRKLIREAFVSPGPDKTAIEPDKVDALLNQPGTIKVDPRLSRGSFCGMPLKPDEEILLHDGKTARTWPPFSAADFAGKRIHKV